VKRVLLGAAALMLMGQAEAPQKPAATEKPTLTGKSADKPVPAAAAPAREPDQPTPMAERVISFVVLDKNNGQVRDFKVKPGAVVNVGRLTIRTRACEATPPWERPWSGAFLQIDDHLKRGGVKRVFSGWLFAESPSLNSFEHPIYDVWVKSCAMSFPEVGPDTIVAGRASSSAGKASSAKKSASTDSAESNNER
jgi:hypothetical protein